MSLENCLLAADLLGESPDLVLTANGKDAEAILIAKLYGPARPATDAGPACSPDALTVAQQFDRLSARDREIVLAVLRPMDTALFTQTRGPRRRAG